MTKKILIIDDSALMRRVLSDIIKSDKRFIVEDLANNGLEGFDLVTREDKKYDAIILDINMPKMNGIEFLEMLEKHRLKSKVIVVSTIAKEGAKETIRALELGAFDFITKPESLFEVKSNAFKERILTCLCAAVSLESERIVREIADVRQVLHSITQEASVKELPKAIKPTVSRGKRVTTQNHQIVALACSTGGPKALQSVIPLLPKNMDCSMIIVQHMPAGFTKSLAVRLNELSNVLVKEAEDGEDVLKGVVYIAQGGKHLKCVQGADGRYKLSITDEPARMGLKPCADILYESLAETELQEVTCVVLTGMGADGTRGIKLLKEKKDVYVISQDEETSTVYGMPKMVATAGLTDEVVPLTLVADAVIKYVGVK